MADAPDAPVLEEVAGSWTCSRTFPARRDQVRQVRAFLRQVLFGCPLLDEVVLICSELATNAVLHSASREPGGMFTLRCEAREHDYVWVQVEDQGGRWAEDDGSVERGRGLDIIAVLADYWDIRGDDTGRAVCARLDWPVPVPDSA